MMTSQPGAGTQQDLREGQKIIQSLKDKHYEKRNRAERVADGMTRIFGRMWFVLFNLFWVVIWSVVNLHLIPGVDPFDPFPFGFLPVLLSLEAIVLAIFVLISQNRAAKIADLRAEIDLQVNIATERELTKLMKIVSAIAEKQGIDLSQDEELRTMLEPMPMSKIEDALEAQVVKEG